MEEKEDPGIISIMNHSYMNDPIEGKLLQELLGIDDECKDERKVLNSHSIYLKSFSELVDYLPMWNLYGGQGKGVCVIIDAEKTFKNTELYSICYVSNGGDEFIVQGNTNSNETNKIKHIIYLIKSIIEKYENDNKFRNYAVSEIELVSYLFKNANYAYEKETRFLCGANPKDEILIDTNENYRLLSIKSPFKLYIDEVILGPCFGNANLYVPYLDKLCKLLKQQNNIRITNSNIDFR